MRERPPLGPYRRPLHRALWWVLGGGPFLMGEKPLSLADEKAPSHTPGFGLTRDLDPVGE